MLAYKRQTAVEAAKRETLDRQLDFLVGQTQRYSSLLAKKLAAESERSRATADAEGSKAAAAAQVPFRDQDVLNANGLLLSRLLLRRSRRQLRRRCPAVIRPRSAFAAHMALGDARACVVSAFDTCAANAYAAFRAVSQCLTSAAVVQAGRRAPARGPRHQVSTFQPASRSAVHGSRGRSRRHPCRHQSYRTSRNAASGGC